MQQKPQKVFFIHGEETALLSLARAVGSLGYAVEVPTLFEEIDLSTQAHQVYKAAGAPVPAMQQEAVSAHAARIAAQAKRIMALLDALGGESAETQLKLRIMEKDVAQLADKWEELLKG